MSQLRAVGVCHPPPAALMPLYASLPPLQEMDNRMVLDTDLFVAAQSHHPPQSSTATSTVELHSMIIINNK